MSIYYVVIAHKRIAISPPPHLRRFINMDIIYSVLPTVLERVAEYNTNPNMESLEISLRGIGELSYKTVREVASNAEYIYVEGYNSIGENAFVGSSIRSIRIGNSIIGIRDKAFYGVKTLKSVSFVDSSRIKSIGYRSFSGTSIGKVKLPKSTSVIFDEAFSHCVSLKSVTITGNYLEYVGNDVFKGTTGIFLKEDNTSLSHSPTDLVKTVSSSTHTISGTGELTQAKVQSVIGDGTGAVDIIVTGYSSIGERAFYESAVSGSMTLPTSVTSIGNFAFRDCTAMTSLNLHELNQLTTVGKHAFMWTGLTGSVTIPASITSLGDTSFYGCYNLTSASFESGSQLTMIDRGMFRNCNNLTGSITLPTSVTSINEYAFYGCSSLSSVNLHELTQLETIGRDAFEDSGLTGSITLPASLKILEWGAFYECLNPFSITIESGSQLTTLDHNVFRYSGLSGSFTIPASVLTMGYYVFQHCTSLTSVVVESGSNLTSLGTLSFEGSGVTSFSAPPSVLRNLGIADGQNTSVSGLPNVTIASSVKDINVLAGMNFVGIGLEGTIEGSNISSVYELNLDSDTLTYKNTEGDSSIYQIRAEKAYWIDTSNSSSLTFTLTSGGEAENPATKDMTEGMNLFSLRAPGVIHGDSIESVYSYSPVNQGYIPIVRTNNGEYGDHFSLQDNVGYWVITNASAPINIS